MPLLTSLCQRDDSSCRLVQGVERPYERSGRYHIHCRIITHDKRQILVPVTIAITHRCYVINRPVRFHRKAIVPIEIVGSIRRRQIDGAVDDTPFKRGSPTISGATAPAFSTLSCRKDSANELTVVESNHSSTCLQNEAIV